MELKVDQQRETFSGKMGFVLSCIGAAIGLGNIWMFSWRLGQYGGAAFLVPYFIFVFCLGTTGLMEEFAFGRSQKKGSIGAFEKVLGEKKISFGGFLGSVPVISQAGVFIFYVIVVGWILKYFSLSIMGSFQTMDVPATFGGFAGQPESIIWQMFAIILTLVIVRMGVSKGIESANKIMMPALFTLFLILAVRSLTLPGAVEGLKYLFIPKWELLLDPITWIMALGQAYFSVSLGGASMVVYGSYLKDDTDIPSSALSTAFFDTLFALLAAIVIIPACFAFNLDPTAGPPLLFITLPSILQVMPGGYIFSILFFIALVFAALTSVINLMEVVVEAIMDRLKLSRNRGVFITAILGFLAGLPLALSIDRFGAFVDLVSVYLVPIGAVFAAVTFFWIYGADRAREQVNMGAKKPMGKWFEYFGKYVFTGVSILVLILAFVYKGI